MTSTHLHELTQIPIVLIVPVKAFLRTHPGYEHILVFLM